MNYFLIDFAGDGAIVGEECVVDCEYYEDCMAESKDGDV